jgi:GntR family transcriptional regulator/MocR family aminotransferase
MRYREMLTVSIALDRGGDRSLHRQLADQICTAIDAGSLVSDARMPSTRTLASLFGVSRGVTAAAYDLLTERGYVHAKSGSGTYVRARAKPVARSKADEAEIIDMRPGLPSTEAMPIRAWRAAWRQASHQPPPVGDPPLLGLPVLREAIAAHLRLTRGLVTSDHQVVVTTGLGAGLRLVLDVVGESRAALEHPAPPTLWRSIRAVPLVSDIPCRVVAVSPDGHNTTGRVMSADRRQQLAGWSARTGGTIVEMMGDNVVRPSTAPRLVDLAERTCVAGEFRDLLAMQLGYVLVPSHLLDRIGHLDRPSHIMQLAAAHLLANGVRLVHRVGQVRARKRAIVESVLSQPVGNTIVLPLPTGVLAADVVTELLGRGVHAETLAAYHFAPEPAPQALLLGYSHLPDSVLRKALSELTKVLTRMAREHGGTTDLAARDGQVVRGAG